MKEEDFRFDEADDPRTWGEELVPDCEKNKNLPVLEYLSGFRALINACGQVSYFYNMRLSVAVGVNKAARVIAPAYHHNFRYYDDKLKDWRAKAKKSFIILEFHGKKLGYYFSEQTSFLNSLALSKDRREAYKGYLDTCFKQHKALSPNEMEEKFQKRLQKRLNKAKK